MSDVTRRVPSRHAAADLARVLGLCAFAAVGLARAPSAVGLLADTAVWALAAVGVSLVLGQAGQPFLCQASFMLVGAYSYAHVARDAGLDLPAWVGLLAAAAAGALVGLVVTPVVRVRGYAFALATITLDLFIRQVFRTGTWVPGKATGLFDVPPVTLGPVHLVSPRDHLWLTVAILVAVLAAAHLATSRGRARRALATIAADEHLFAAVGGRAGIVKGRMVVAGATLGAAAGALHVASFGLLEPDSFSTLDSFALATAVIIGGRRRLLGAVVGAFVFELVGPVLGPDLAQYRLIVLGVVVVLCMHLAPEGLLPGLPPSWTLAGRRRPSDDAAGDEVAPLAGDGLLVEVDDLVCAYGAVHAVDHLDLTLEPGRVTAIVGPNGSGKSTLLAAVAGTRPRSGHIRFDTEDVTRWSRPRRARAGVARSFQRTRNVPALSALDNVVLGVDQHSRATGERPDEDRRRRRAHRALGLVGIDHLADRTLAELPPADQRFVELARVLAARPRLALLDEPCAGLDPHELARLDDVVQALVEGGTTVALVEHHLPFVVQAASTVVVLDEGRVLATGEPAEALRRPEVVASYVGAVPEATP